MRVPALALTLVGVLLAAGAGGAVAAQGVAGHLDEPYYRVLEDRDWAVFVAAQDLGPPYEVFLTHPWKAPTFTGMSGKPPHTWLNPGSPPVRGADYDAYKRDRSSDGVWLVEREITIIMDPTAPEHPAYVLHPSGAWVLNETLAWELYRIRHGR